MSESDILSSRWTETITPRAGFFDLRLKELWNYRDLTLLFVRRDFVTVYKQTILGPLWHIVQPVATTIVFTLIFGGIAKLPTDGQPAFLFYMCGTTIWSYFAQCLSKTSNTFVGNASIFGKVYFPRMTVPLANVISSLFSFGIQLALFIAVYSWFWWRGAEFQPNAWLFIVPLLVLIMAVLGLGLGIVISSLTTKYRDLTFVVGFGVQLLMYATPVIYPMSAVPDKVRWLIYLNPVSSLVETFRHAFTGSGSVPLPWLAYSAAVSFLLFLCGMALFHRVEKTFMDSV
ncbi:ABC transporter permease [Kamptonema cortianum]|nr:ABC transporter permease [Oscillatoria laete-virens]MDK3155368.1 ABC transporter permease [Kamptonema cortianum]MDL5046117.1 ABC transporter permease [Oscillatoria amoena NRMC-F 0135]MDL5052818.1 ABC transporter permease [Oscillatoria laete-virens NRMC-F 0139]